MKRKSYREGRDIVNNYFTDKRTGWTVYATGIVEGPDDNLVVWRRKQGRNVTVGKVPLGVFLEMYAPLNPAGKKTG